jgi:large subunit ribosomal protein L15e
MILDKNYQQVAEERVSRKYTNCEVLNSYPVAKDGLYAWYEVILVDWAHPSISADERVGWIGDQRGRAERGLTSAGKKARGLRSTGQGSEKLRPSRAAVFRRKVKRQHLKGNTKF